MTSAAPGTATIWRVEGGGGGTPAYARSYTDVAAALGVRPEQGLGAVDVETLLARYGPNRLAGGRKESALAAFGRQYRDYMQIILLAAAVVNLVVTRSWSTTIVLAGLTVFNAVIGLRQEAKAEQSVHALQRMMRTTARVR